MILRAVLTFASGAVLGVAGVLGAQAFLSAHQPQPYAGQETRVISSLSPEDQRALRAGEGWGLAKPAELNGYPGPAHVLELDAELGLTDVQRKAVEAAFADMRTKAQDLGAQLIDAEAALDAAFDSGTVTEDLLQARLTAAEALRADLRGTHLAAHLAVTPLLDETQKQKYASLRGYTSGGGHSQHSGH